MYKHILLPTDGSPISRRAVANGVKLARVLGALIEQGLVRQDRGARDRRQRLLFLTAEGEALERRVSAPQRDRVARAYREAGAEAVAGYRKVLAGLIDERDREGVLKAIERR